MAPARKSKQSGRNLRRGALSLMLANMASGAPEIYSSPAPLVQKQFVVGGRRVIPGVTEPVFDLPRVYDRPTEVGHRGPILALPLPPGYEQEYHPSMTPIVGLALAAAAAREAARKRAEAADREAVAKSEKKFKKEAAAREAAARTLQKRFHRTQAAKKRFEEQEAKREQELLEVEERNHRRATAAAKSLTWKYAAQGGERTGQMLGGRPLMTPVVWNKKIGSRVQRYNISNDNVEETPIYSLSPSDRQDRLDMWYG